MRNANAQRANTMIRVGALQQPPAPHVSHAEIGGRCVALATPDSKEHESHFPAVSVQKFYRTGSLDEF